MMGTSESTEGGGTEPRADNEEAGAVEVVNRGLEALLQISLGLIDPVAGPGLAVGAATLFEVRRERLQRRALEVARAADAEGGAAVVEALRTDARFEDLVFRASEAGARTSLRAKRIALGRAVARAATDTAQLDSSEFLVAALLELDAPHLQTLARMRDGHDRAAETDGPDHAARVMTARFRDAHPAVRAALLRHGTIDEYYENRERSSAWIAQRLVTEVGADNIETSVHYALSSFGRRLLEDVESAAAEDEHSDD